MNKKDELRHECALVGLMKIKLVKFNDIDANGSNEIDYGLFIGEVYDVVDRDTESGSFTVINDIGMQVNVFADEVEVQS